MAEPTTTEPTEAPKPEVVVVKTSRLKSFQLNHPRTAKVVGIVAVTAATFGVLAWRKNKQAVNDDATEDSTSDVPFDSDSPATT